MNHLILPLLWTSNRYCSSVSQVRSRLFVFTVMYTTTGVFTTSVTLPSHSSKIYCVATCVISTRISRVSTGALLRSNLQKDNSILIHFMLYDPIEVSVQIWIILLVIFDFIQKFYWMSTFSSSQTSQTSGNFYIFFF